MFVKYDDNHEIISLFYGCKPSDTTGYVEVPDDEEIAKQYFEKRYIPSEDPTPSQLDIIEAQVTYTAMMTDTLLEV